MNMKIARSQERRQFAHAQAHNTCSGVGVLAIFPATARYNWSALLCFTRTQAHLCCADVHFLDFQWSQSGGRIVRADITQPTALRLVDCTFSGNRVDGPGSLILIEAAPAWLEGCTLADFDPTLEAGPPQILHGVFYSDGAELFFTTMELFELTGAPYTLRDSEPRAVGQRVRPREEPPDPEEFLAIDDLFIVRAARVCIPVSLFRVEVLLPSHACVTRTTSRPQSAPYGVQCRQRHTRRCQAGAAWSTV